MAGTVARYDALTSLGRNSQDDALAGSSPVSGSQGPPAQAAIILPFPSLRP